MDDFCAEWLRSDDPLERKTGLLLSSTMSMSEIGTYINDSDEHIRMIALEKAARVDTNALLTGLQDENRDVRFRTSVLLSTKEDGEAALVEGLENDDSLVRLVCARSLRDRKSEIPQKLAHSSRWEVRESAIRAGCEVPLQRMECELHPVVRRSYAEVCPNPTLLDDEHAPVRLAAINHAPPDALCSRFSREENFVVRRKILEALSEVPLTFAATALEDTDDTVRMEAMRLYRRSSLTDVGPLVSRYTHDKGEIRASAIEQLLSLGHTEMISDALQDTDPRVRRSVMAHSSALPANADVEPLLNPEEDIDLQLAAVEQAPAHAAASLAVSNAHDMAVRTRALERCMVLDNPALERDMIPEVTQMMLDGVDCKDLLAFLLRKRANWCAMMDALTMMRDKELEIVHATTQAASWAPMMRGPSEDRVALCSMAAESGRYHVLALMLNDEATAVWTLASELLHKLKVRAIPSLVWQCANESHLLRDRAWNLIQRCVENEKWAPITVFVGPFLEREQFYMRAKDVLLKCGESHSAEMCVGLLDGDCWKVVLQVIMSFGSQRATLRALEVVGSWVDSTEPEYMDRVAPALACFDANDVLAQMLTRLGGAGQHIAMRGLQIFGPRNSVQACRVVLPYCKHHERNTVKMRVASIEALGVLAPKRSVEALAVLTECIEESDTRISRAARRAYDQIASTKPHTRVKTVTSRRKKAAAQRYTKKLPSRASRQSHSPVKNPRHGVEENQRRRKQRTVDLEAAMERAGGHRSAGSKKASPTRGTYPTNELNPQSSVVRQKGDVMVSRTSEPGDALDPRATIHVVDPIAKASRNIHRSTQMDNEDAPSKASAARQYETASPCPRTTTRDDVRVAHVRAGGTATDDQWHGDTRPVSSNFAARLRTRDRNTKKRAERKHATERGERGDARQQRTTKSDSQRRMPVATSNTVDTMEDIASSASPRRSTRPPYMPAAKTSAAYSASDACVSPVESTGSVFSSHQSSPKSTTGSDGRQSCASDMTFAVPRFVNPAVPATAERVSVRSRDSPRVAGHTIENAPHSAQDTTYVTPRWPVSDVECELDTHGTPRWPPDDALPSASSSTFAASGCPAHDGERVPPLDIPRTTVHAPPSVRDSSFAATRWPEHHGEHARPSTLSHTAENIQHSTHQSTSAATRSSAHVNEHAVRYDISRATEYTPHTVHQSAFEGTRWPVHDAEHASPSDIPHTTEDVLQGTHHNGFAAASWPVHDSEHVPPSAIPNTTERVPHGTYHNSSASARWPVHKDEHAPTTDIPYSTEHASHGTPCNSSAAARRPAHNGQHVQPSDIARTAKRVPQSAHHDTSAAVRWPMHNGEHALRSDIPQWSPNTTQNMPHVAHHNASVATHWSAHHAEQAPPRDAPHANQHVPHGAHHNTLAATRLPATTGEHAQPSDTQHTHQQVPHRTRHDSFVAARRSVQDGEHAESRDISQWSPNTTQNVLYSTDRNALATTPWPTPHAEQDPPRDTPHANQHVPDGAHHTTLAATRLRATAGEHAPPGDIQHTNEYAPHGSHHDTVAAEQAPSCMRESMLPAPHLTSHIGIPSPSSRESPEDAAHDTSDENGFLSAMIDPRILEALPPATAPPRLDVTQVKEQSTMKQRNGISETDASWTAFDPARESQSSEEPSSPSSASSGTDTPPVPRFWSPSSSRDIAF